MVTADSITYIENDEEFEATILGVENGILKFSYTQDLLGNEFVYNYGLKINGENLDLINCDNNNDVLATLTIDEGGDIGGGVTLPEELDGVWTAYDEAEEATYTLTFDGDKVTWETDYGFGFDYIMTDQGTVTSYNTETGMIEIELDENGSRTLFFVAQDNEITWTVSGDTVTFTKQGGSSSSVTLPEELTGIWTGEDEDGEPYVLTFDGLNVTYWGLSGTVVAYDGETGVLTLSLQSLMGGAMPHELLYDAETHTIVDETFSVTLTKQGEVAPVELPEELTGVWTGTDDEDMLYELTFDGLDVTFIADKGGMSEYPFSGKVTAYDATSKQLTITLTMMGAVSFAFDPAAMTLTGSDMFPVTLTKQGGSSSSVTLPEELTGIWTAYDEAEDATYTLTFDGDKVTWVTNYDIELDETDQGTVTSYNSETGMIEIELDAGGSRTLFFVAKDNEITWTVGEDTVTFTKQGGSSSSVTLPKELTGIWSGDSEEEDFGKCTLTFDGLNVTYAIEGGSAFLGTVSSYDEATHTLTLLLTTGVDIGGGTTSLELAYDPDKHTLTDNTFSVTLTKQDSSSSGTLPSELTGVWTGTDEYKMVYELTFDGLNVTLIADKGGTSETTFTGTVTEYDATSKTLTITIPMGAVTFVFDSTAMTLTCSNYFPVTLHKQGSATTSGSSIG